MTRIRRKAGGDDAPDGLTGNAGCRLPKAPGKGRRSQRGALATGRLSLYPLRATVGGAARR